MIDRYSCRSGSIQCGVVVSGRGSQPALPLVNEGCLGRFGILASRNRLLRRVVDDVKGLLGVDRQVLDVDEFDNGWI